MMVMHIISTFRLVKVALLRLLVLFPLVSFCVLIFGSHSAFATFITITAYGDQNDCAGYFSDYDNSPPNGFDTCQIFHSGDTLTLISPVIAKFEGNLSSSNIKTAINNEFISTVSGDEWVFTDSNEDKIYDTWTYSPDDEDDPAIRYWSVKAGSNPNDGGFYLFWVVEGVLTDDIVTIQTEDGTEECKINDNKIEDVSLNCLNAALVVNTGMWVTPKNKNLSHIVFYDSEEASIVPPSEEIVPPSEVPEPNILLLMATGLMVLGLYNRRKVAGRRICSTSKLNKL